MKVYYIVNGHESTELDYQTTLKILRDNGIDHDTLVRHAGDTKTIWLESAPTVAPGTDIRELESKVELLEIEAKEELRKLEDKVGVTKLEIVK